MQRFWIVSLLFLLSLPVFAQQKTAPQPNAVEFQDAIFWLVGGMPSSSLRDLIQERGAGFPSGKQTDETLRLFGADDELITTLKKRSVGKSQAKPRDFEPLHKALHVGPAEAEELLRAMMHPPNSAAMDYAMAHVLFDRDDSNREAVDYAMKAAAAEPSLAETQNLLAYGYYRAGDPVDTIAVANRTIASHLNNAEAYKIRGLGYQLTGDLDSAIRDFKEALRIRPGYGSALSNLAMAFENKGDVAQAEELFRQAIKADPGSWYGYYNLGYLKKHSGDNVAAIDLYKQALELNPESPRIRTNLAGALCDTQNFAQAAQEFKELFDRMADWDVGRGCYAKSLFSMQRYQEAILQAKEGIKQDPFDRNSHRYLGLSYVMLNRPEDALPELSLVVKMAPQYLRLHLDLAGTLFTLNRFDEGVAELREAMKVEPLNPQPHAMLGGQFLHVGRSEEGIAEYAEAERLQHDDIYADIIAAEKSKMLRKQQQP